MRTEELDNTSLKSYVPTSGIPDGTASVVCMYLPADKYPRTMSADISSADHISSGVTTVIFHFRNLLSSIIIPPSGMQSAILCRAHHEKK